MKTTVGRTYRFRATHSLPKFGPPWCYPHQHDYTVEIEAEGGTDTDKLDAFWDGNKPVAQANISIDSMATTVENIAAWLLDRADASVLAVTVWEDRQRWGRAER